MCSHKQRAFVICMLQLAREHDEHSTNKMASVECENTAVSLKEVPFRRRTTNAEKATIKQIGPLDLKRQASVFESGGVLHTIFQQELVPPKPLASRLCSQCTFFCYPCLRFHPENNTADGTAWTLK